MSDKKEKDGPVSWCLEHDHEGSIWAVSSEGKRVSYDDWSATQTGDKLKVNVTNNTDQTVTFNSAEGGPIPPSGTISIDGTGDAVFRTYDGTDWISANPNSVSITGDSIVIGNPDGGDADFVVNGIDVLNELKRIAAAVDDTGEVVEEIQKKLSLISDQDPIVYSGGVYQRTKIRFTDFTS